MTSRTSLIAVAFCILAACSKVTPSKPSQVVPLERTLSCELRGLTRDAQGEWNTRFDTADDLDHLVIAERRNENGYQLVRNGYEIVLAGVGGGEKFRFDVAKVEESNVHFNVKVTTADGRKRETQFNVKIGAQAERRFDDLGLGVNVKVVKSEKPYDWNQHRFRAATRNGESNRKESSPGPMSKDRDSGGEMP